MSREFAGYDAWLEKPYQDAADEWAAIEQFAERREMPYETDDEIEAVKAAMEEEAEAAGEAEAEYRAELRAEAALYDDREEW